MKTDKAELERLYHRFHQVVYRRCLSIGLGNRDWAMDRTQDFFIVLNKNLHRLRDREDLGPWVYRVTTNVCLKQLRTETRWGRFLDRQREAGGSSPRLADRDLQERRDIEDLKRALQRLPARQRTLFALVFLESKSQSEAAAELGISKGYASKLISKIQATLRRSDWELLDD